MKRPAFQFYPADWRKDVELQSCSMAAQGLWINVMCLAHECEPYGHLTVNGKAMTAAQIGRHVGTNQRETQALIDELMEAGVARRTDEGALFSKRMVADEDLRNRRAAGGKEGAEHGIKGAEAGIKGGRPKADKGGFETPLPDAQKPPPSSSSSSSPSGIDIPPTEVPVSPRSVEPPTPPPAFDGNNAKALNGKFVVPIAAGWELPEQWGVDAESLGWAPAEVLREAEKFRQYWVAGKGSGKRRSVKGWRQSWSTWLGKAAEQKR